MRRALTAYFVLVLLVMLGLTVVASLERGVFAALEALGSDGWFRATLADAYFGFLAFWLWIAYREGHWGARLGWLVGVLLLGNFAMAAYALRALGTLPAGSPAWQALLRPEHRPPAPVQGSSR
jgi:hypothetical protein